MNTSIENDRVTDIDDYAQFSTLSIVVKLIGVPVGFDGRLIFWSVAFSYAEQCESIDIMLYSDLINSNIRLSVTVRTISSILRRYLQINSKN